MTSTRSEHAWEDIECWTELSNPALPIETACEVENRSKAQLLAAFLSRTMVVLFWQKLCSAWVSIGRGTRGHTTLAQHAVNFSRCVHGHLQQVRPAALRKAHCVWKTPAAHN